MLKRGRRLAVFLIAATLATWATWQLSQSDSGNAGRAEDGPGAYSELLEQYRSALKGLQESVDLEEAQRVLHTASGALDPDPGHYATRLQGFVEDFFAHSPFQGDLAQAVGDATITVPTGLRGPDQTLSPRRSIPKRVFSYDRRGRNGVPREFIWDERLNPPGKEQEWVVEVADDRQMDQWFEHIVAVQQDDVSSPPTAKSSVEGSGAPLDYRQNHATRRSGADRWRRLWQGIRENRRAGVLRSDLLRYLMLLTQGGLYTDSDTAPLSHPDLWGSLATDRLPAPLANIELAAESLRVKQTARATPEVRAGLLSPDSPINLVVAVEYDLTHPDQDIREGYNRNLQIAQWTIMARPLHPVFIDVLETATRRLNRMIDEDTMWHGIDVLGVTGPGAFGIDWPSTDAVFRYLLLRYGFNPLRLRNMQGGVVIGDVLILPLHAFGLTVDPTEWGWNGSSAATRCVTHHFRSRWKG